MKLYLDVCTIRRPFDNQNNMRIRLETDAYYLILNGIQRKRYEMVISTMHLREVESIEDIKEKVQIVNLLDVYGKELKYNYEKIRKRADELILKKLR